MSKYTVEFRKILHYPSLQRALTEYPQYSDAQKARLNSNIVGHYYMREIGHETPELFIQQLEARLGLIMPFYIELYRSADLEYDILDGLDMSTDSSASSETKATGTDKSKVENETKSASGAVNYAFPQSQIGTGQHATSKAETEAGNEATTDQTGERESDTTSTESNTTRTRGRQQSGAALIAEHRATIINIDRAIIDELFDLFMGIM